MRHPGTEHGLHAELVPCLSLLSGQQLWYYAAAPLFYLVFLDQEDKSQLVIMLTFLYVRKLLVVCKIHCT